MWRFGQVPSIQLNLCSEFYIYLWKSTYICPKHLHFFQSPRRFPWFPFRSLNIANCGRFRTDNKPNIHKQSGIVVGSFIAVVLAVASLYLCGRHKPIRDMFRHQHPSPCGPSNFSHHGIQNQILPAGMIQASGLHYYHPLADISKIRSPVVGEIGELHAFRDSMTPEGFNRQQTPDALERRLELPHPDGPTPVYMPHAVQVGMVHSALPAPCAIMVDEYRYVASCPSSCLILIFCHL